MPYSRQQIVWNDWPALASATAIPIIWAIFIGFHYLKPNAVPLSPWLPTTASIAVGAILIWRMSRIRRLFEWGSVADGVVTDLLIAKDRGRLEFAYEVDGKQIVSWMPIHKTKAVLELYRGKKIKVLYDRSAPRCAIVQDLFAA